MHIAHYSYNTARDRWEHRTRRRAANRSSRQRSPISPRWRRSRSMGEASNRQLPTVKLSTVNCQPTAQLSQICVTQGCEGENNGRGERRKWRGQVSINTAVVGLHGSSPSFPTYDLPQLSSSPSPRRSQSQSQPPVRICIRIRIYPFQFP